MLLVSFKNLLRLAVCYLLLSLTALAQTTAPTDDVEWWPDMQLNWRIKPKFTFVLFGTLRKGQHNDEPITRQIGIGFNSALHRNFTMAGQYRHVTNEFTPARRTEENRYYIDLTPRIALRAGFQLSDRNRIEFRDIGGNFSMRYRNRLQLERPLSLKFSGHERRITPYVSYEAFYDTRIQGWARQQIYTGSRIPLVNHVTFNGFYMRQWDKQARPGYLHVIASFLIFDF